MDSLWFVYQCTSGEFAEIQPIFIPIVCRALISAGGSVGLITLLQIVSGLLGIRALAIETLRLIGILDYRAIDPITFLLLAAVSSPLTPLLMLLITFWTDTWVAVLLLWIAALLLRARRESQAEFAKGGGGSLWTVGVLLGCVMLVRFNSAVIALPVLLFVWLLLRPWRHTIIVASIALSIVAAFQAYKVAVIKPPNLRPVNAVYALDLASMITYDPSICNNLSLTSCDLVRGVFPSWFIVGDGAIDYTMDQRRVHPYDGFRDLYFHPTLANEYLMELREHPRLLATVKFLNFVDYLQGKASRFYYPTTIRKNTLGIAHTRWFADQRFSWVVALESANGHRFVRLLSFVHGVWLLANVLALLLCLWAKRRGQQWAIPLMYLLLVPAAYYASFYLALPSSEFRFMYPSMLLMQVLTLSALAAWLVRRASAFTHEPASHDHLSAAV